jgi:CheY-like chemotaxis protein
MAKKQILIVEDDAVIRDALKDILEDEGFEVVLASNGKVALDLLQAASQLPNVILLDIMMPIMDGFQFRELQLANDRLAAIPTIPLSADGNIVEKSKKLKAALFLRKPVELEALLNAVNGACV